MKTHQDLATRLGLHFTFSPEDRQSQPGTDDFDNSQIRLSNGTNIFTPGALAPGVAVENVKYYMADLDAGLKYRGFALEGEYYWRWLNDFRADGPVPENSAFRSRVPGNGLRDGLPKTMQLYTMGSYIFGDFGNSPGRPPPVSTGGSSSAASYASTSSTSTTTTRPIGYTAIPQVVGGTGLDLHR